jgi:hypothetical protein
MPGPADNVPRHNRETKSGRAASREKRAARTPHSFVTNVMGHDF